MRTSNNTEMHKELRAQFIKAFYFKSEGSLRTDLNPREVGQLVNLSTNDIKHFTEYFKEKGMLDSKKSYGDGIRMTSVGVDYVDNLLDGKKINVLRFIEAQYITHPTKALYGFYYWYTIKDEEKEFQKKISLYISYELMVNWGLVSKSQEENLEKVLLQFARTTIEEKLKEGTLNDIEEHILLTDNSPDQCPYDPTNLPNTTYAVYGIEVTKKSSSSTTINTLLVDEIDTVRRLQTEELKVQLEEQKRLVDEMKRHNMQVNIRLQNEEREQLSEATLQHASSSETQTSTLVIDYNFPEEIKPACNQYLMYFSQFLADCGIDADTELKSTVKETLFKVTPRDGTESLEKIKAALNIYLNMATNPDFATATDNSTDVAVMQMQANVFHFQSQLMLYKSVTQMNQATIESLQLNNYRLNQKLSEVDPKKDEEEVIKGVISVVPIEGNGMKFNLPEIVRMLKRKIRRS